ncbi:putative RDD family membrane protein YckC [Paenibacillus sp. W2I17]|nr:putative RDD family membrane protein YckC [Paenibacillus sp. W2I17]
MYVLTLVIGIIVSALMVGMREDRRAIHDFVAGTEVVWD